MRDNPEADGDPTASETYNNFEPASVKHDNHNNLNDHSDYNNHDKLSKLEFEAV
jgi:hypothetical protein